MLTEQWNLPAYFINLVLYASFTDEEVELNNTANKHKSKEQPYTRSWRPRLSWC